MAYAPILFQTKVAEIKAKMAKIIVFLMHHALRPILVVSSQAEIWKIHCIKLLN